MRRPRVRISTLIGLILACALALAALRQASPQVEQVVFTATVIALILAPLRATFRPGAPRAYWSGFALAGTTYLALSLIPNTVERLATTRLLDHALEWISHSIGNITVSDGGRTITFKHDASAILTTDGPITFTTSPSTTTNGTWFKQISGSTIMMGNATPIINLTSGPNSPIDWESFRRTGHDLFAWAFGAIGGMIARAWYRGPGHKHGWERLGAA